MGNDVHISAGVDAIDCPRLLSGEMVAAGTVDDMPGSGVMHREMPPVNGKSGVGPERKSAWDRARLIEMALMALDKVGGVNYLVETARLNRPAFMAFLRAMIPHNIQVDGTVTVTWEQMVERYMAARRIEAGTGGHLHTDLPALPVARTSQALDEVFIALPGGQEIPVSWGEAVHLDHSLPTGEAARTKTS